jgi:cytochrome c
MRTLRALLFGLGMILTIVLAACGGSPATPAAGPEIPVTISASGDAAEGKVVFENTGCNGCHASTAEKLVGPGLAGLFVGSGPRLPDGVDYGGNLPNSQPRTEENVAAWIRTGGEGKIGIMSGREISDEDMADLLAYLRTLK